MVITSKYKAKMEVNKSDRPVGKEIEINIPITIDFEEIERFMDMLELDEIMSYLVENYHLIEIEKKLNEIKELDNE